MQKIIANLKYLLKDKSFEVMCDISKVNNELTDFEGQHKSIRLCFILSIMYLILC